MLKKITFVSLITLGCITTAYAQQKSTLSREPTAEAGVDDPENDQRTVILRRETKRSAPPVDTKVKVPVDNKPIIIVLPQQRAPTSAPQIVMPVVTPTTPAPAIASNNNDDSSKKKSPQNETDESRPAFFMGIEGGYLQGKFAESSLRNWEYGYRWTKSNDANANVARAYVGYYIGSNFSVETGMLISTHIKGSRHTKASISSDYDTTLRLSGFDFMLKYSLPSGFFVKGGYSYIETVASSYVEYAPTNKPTGQMRWTYGTESAMHLAAGTGLNFALNRNVSLTLGVVHYRTIFTYFRNRFNLYTVGLQYKF